MAPRGSIAVSWPMSNFSSSGNVTGVVGSMEFLATSLPTIRNDIISAVVLSGFIFASHAGGSLAGEANTTHTFKSLQGISINAGQKRGIRGRCKLM